MKARLKYVTPDAVNFIAAERARQVAEEGYSLIHDDEHENGELALAAACYAVPERRRDVGVNDTFFRRFWPWHISAFKPASPFGQRDNSGRIHELVKAGALIVAEIERLQRADAYRAQSKGGN